MKILLALTLLASPLVASAGYLEDLKSRAGERALSGERKWRRLLHYRGARSEADGQGFFLAPDGRTNPGAELEADLAAFFEPVPAKGQHPQCRFPARYRWLKEKLAFDPKLLPERACPDFEAWRGAIDADAVSVVFASAFLNNPASMFGHTFLRLHHKGGNDALLDYTINFAATPDTGNALLYTLKGLNGSFKGEYSLQPFYMKTQEYGSLELRDLWDYPLNLTQRELDFLIMHGWEMGSTHFNYYFFTKNCSYQLLTLLEAAVDDLDVSGGFFWGVIPTDTVRALRGRPGLVGAPRYRPSFLSELKARRARLDAGGLKAATRLGADVSAAGIAALGERPKPEQALILESAHDYLRHRVGFYTDQSTATKNSVHALLLARGRLGIPSAPAEPVLPKPLEAGHDTARVGFSFGWTRRSTFEELTWRPGLHDLNSPDDGYIPFSHLDASIHVRFDNREKEASLERLAVVDIVSLSPWDSWVKTPSWTFATGAEQAHELGCEGNSCLYYGLGGGAGLAAEAHVLGHELFYALAIADTGFGPVLPQGWRTGAGGRAGVIFDPLPGWRLLVEGSYVDYAQRSSAKQVLRASSVFRLSRDLELKLSAERRVPAQEAGVAFYRYF
ncbi:MAG: DUF4105 domain-containing protein [Elusimicrobia bacterium]|nr:DUF4105 domain-containing protein [Elusimicrobiota bacterium]